MKFKLTYEGFAFVEADSEEEAREKFMSDDGIIYSETNVATIKEVKNVQLSITKDGDFCAFETDEED